jgi:hypothetical protein
LLLFQPENAPANAITQQPDIEVDEQPTFPTTQPQVSKKLRIMNRRQAIDSLQLYNHRVRNNQVHAISTIQPEAFVNHRQGPLTDKRHSLKRKLVAQTLPISRFQQSWSQISRWTSIELPMIASVISLMVII